MKLWNTYINNVDGCSCQKLVHIPTDEAMIFATIDEPSRAPLDNHAFCFAIYFAAAVSLNVTEASNAFGSEPSPHLLNFKLGMEQSLAQANYLDQPTVTALRALAIYLVCV
jgi:hypothetical protein